MEVGGGAVDNEWLGGVITHLYILVYDQVHVVCVQMSLLRTSRL